MKDDAISRSDAIRVASGYCHWSNIPKELAKLPSVNPIPCNDAISRQAVDDAIYDYSRSCDVNYAQIMEYIDKLPSVSMEKTGRWEKLSVGYGCSECSLCTNIHGIQDFKYCPNCGAKMGVEE